MATTDILTRAQQLLRTDAGSPQADWQIVEKLLAEAPSQRDELLEWIFAHHQGYVDTRTQAGREVLRTNPDGTWNTLTKLIRSHDPDDRDTALSLLSESGDPRAPALAKLLLDDPWPYLQLDAAEFLKDDYPAEVTATLQRLCSHKQAWVREAAQKILSKLDKPGETIPSEPL